MGETMPAVVFERPGALRLVRRAVPSLRSDGDVRVRIVATGICGTDRGIALGLFPASPGVILGHEAVGVVEAVGSAVGELRPSDRVVLNPTFFCGRCRPCRRGLAAHCVVKEGREIGVDCDGTMAASAVLEQRFVHRLPRDVPDRRAVLIEPLACVLNNVAAAAPRPDDHVLIAGAGPIGALCALVLASRGARVRVVDRDPTRAALAGAALGSAADVLAGDLDDACAGRQARPDIIVDTTGVVLEGALDVIADAGRVVVMGEREGARATVALRTLVTRGISIVGAGPYSPQTFELAIELARDLPLESLVTHAVALERHADAFELLGVGRDGRDDAGYAALKVLLLSGRDG
jgi:threonine dehydrogenase-like Zn-dependent dehydrogenase